MSYSTDILEYKIKVLNKKDSSQIGFGERPNFSESVVLNADVTWKKGQKALNEGALDSMDTILIRTRYAPEINRNSLIEYDGITYQIQSLHSDFRRNTTQITATELVGDPRQDPPAPEPTPTPTPEPETTTTLPDEEP